MEPKDNVHEVPSYNWKKPLKRNKVKIKYKIFLIEVYYLSKKDINQLLGSVVKRISHLTTEIFHHLFLFIINTIHLDYEPIKLSCA